MSHYYSMVLFGTLKADTPQQVIDAIEWQVRGQYEQDAGVRAQERCLNPHADDHVVWTHAKHPSIGGGKVFGPWDKGVDNEENAAMEMNLFHLNADGTHNLILRSHSSYIYHVYVAFINWISPYLMTPEGERIAFVHSETDANWREALMGRKIDWDRKVVAYYDEDDPFIDVYGDAYETGPVWRKLQTPAERDYERLTKLGEHLQFPSTVTIRVRGKRRDAKR